MTPLAMAIRDLLERRALTQRALAEKIGISPVAMSKIMNGRAKPRQVNLGRIIRALCETPAEEQMIVSAIEAADGPDRGGAPAGDDVDSVRRYMEDRKASVAFQRQVEHALSEAGCAFERAFSRNEVFCDFFLPGPPTTAVECGVDFRRNWQRESTTIRLLRDDLPCSRVLVVVPTLDGLKPESLLGVGEAGGRVVSLDEFRKEVSSNGAHH